MQSIARHEQKGMDSLGVQECLVLRMKGRPVLEWQQHYDHISHDYALLEGFIRPLSRTLQVHCTNHSDGPLTFILSFQRVRRPVSSATSTPTYQSEGALNMSGGLLDKLFRLSYQRTPGEELVQKQISDGVEQVQRQNGY